MLDAKNTLFVCIDLQDRLLPLMARKDEVVKNANILLSAAQILGVQTLVSEQYPRGLGATHADIRLPAQAKVLEKTSFGVFGDTTMREFIAQSGRKCLVFFGIETHICVLQSVVQAANLGYECVVVGDCVSSRSAKSCEMGLDFLRSLGNSYEIEGAVSILPTESVLFSLLKDSKHEKFKEISSLVK